MGISFKISKKGHKYKPKTILKPEVDSDDVLEIPSLSKSPGFVNGSSYGKETPVNGNGEGTDVLDSSLTEQEVSFILNLYLEGYSIGKPSEESLHLSALRPPKLMHPYDASSETFFSAIESGRLPGDALDDIPCKFVNGTLICEIRDYRKCNFELGSGASPVVSKVSLKMSLEDVVKEIPLNLDSSWTYGDLMEVEAQIVKALQPRLSLDPKPRFDRLCSSPVLNKINLGLSNLRRKRLREHQPLMDNSAMRSRSFAQDGSGVTLPLGSQQFGNLIGVNPARTLQDQESGAVGTGQEMFVSYDENGNSMVSLNGKRDYGDGRISLSNPSKRIRTSSIGELGSPMNGPYPSDMNWRNAMYQQVTTPRGMQYSNVNSRQFEVENQMKSEGSPFDQPPRLQHNFGRTNLSIPTWNNSSTKEEQIQKKKSGQSPRVSTGAVAQSPLSSKSGEISSGSGGLTSSQREKPIATSGPATGGLPLPSSDALQRQASQVSSKRRSASVSKTPGSNAVGSPASVSTANVQLNAGSPSVATSNVSDILERLSKIEMITKRKQLIPRRNNVDNYSIRKPASYSLEPLIARFSEIADSRDESGSKLLSKSLLGGSMNVSKTRVINATLSEKQVQGNVVSVVPKVKTRMTLSEKPKDGTVALHYGDIEDGDTSIPEDHLPALPSLPNTHVADLLAGQFCCLLNREGFMVDDQVHLNQVPNSDSADQNLSGVAPTENQVFSEQSSLNPAIASPQNHSANNRMLPPGSPQVSHVPPTLMSGLSMPIRSQFDPQQTIQQQLAQQQSVPPQNQNTFGLPSHPQFQHGPPMVLPSNPLPHLNQAMQLGGHMVNKTSLQMQLLQQQQQQQQQAQQLQKHGQMQPRKMMMGLGTAMGMANLPNNIVGLGGLNNGMGLVRGMGGSGLSSPMSPIGLTSIGHPSQTTNINRLSQQFRNGQLTPNEAALISQRIRMASQTRSTMLGGNQPGMSAVRPGHPTSAGLNILNQSLNRGNMNPMQRSAISAMGPPKQMAGMNIYANQQQQQQQLQMEQQQQLQQQLQQQQQHLQDSSTLQAVVSSAQVGSPSTMVIPQLSPMPQQTFQQPSPQQLIQRTPVSPQMSSGAIHGITAGNPDGPSSPQVSSQTLNSGGSISNSPMELQIANKGNTLNNV